jgi:hypothetical protein
MEMPRTDKAVSRSRQTVGRSVAFVCGAAGIAEATETAIRERA